MAVVTKLFMVADFCTILLKFSVHTVPLTCQHRCDSSQLGFCFESQMSGSLHV